MIKVFVIDDSALVRNEVKKIFQPIDDIEVIGSAPNPVDAFEVFQKVGLPDVFILDIEMPKMDGITFLEQIGKQKPIPTIICSTLVEKGSSTTIDALRMGAVDIVQKPTSDINRFFSDIQEDFVRKVRIAAQSRVSFLGRNVSRQSGSKVLNPNQVSSSVKAASSLPPSKKIIAIGASTGGVQILEELLKQLEPNHPPIVITQHMPPGFTKSFADRLDSILPSSHIKEASEGDTLMHGRILIAPGDLHMEVVKNGFAYKVALKNYPKVNSHKPSVNVLFRSMAKEVGIFGIGMILTGMGDDGATGLLEMKNAGASTYAQEEKSCIVYGMPKRAVELGAAKETLSLEEMAKIINTVR
jgi:two-component system chemotaxis response regulator CheB